MKDAIRRIFIVVICLICAALVIGYFTRIKSEEETHNEVELTVNNVEEKEEEIVEKETDEIEQYSNSKARVNTTLNFRVEPNIESSILAKLTPETVVDVKAKIRNRMV